jgi:hypothetical protein
VPVGRLFSFTCSEYELVEFSGPLLLFSVLVPLGVECPARFISIALFVLVAILFWSFAVGRVTFQLATPGIGTSLTRSRSSHPHSWVDFGLAREWLCWPVLLSVIVTGCSCSNQNVQVLFFSYRIKNLKVL